MTAKDVHQPPKRGAPIDLGSIGPADALPTREQAVAGREPWFQVVVAPSALEDVRLHGRSQPDVEVCGVLVGNVYRDAAGPYLYIAANVRGNNAAGKAAQVTFTAETWTHIQGVMEREHEGQRIVGWYHTHPGFGIFLSDMDLFIQNNFFGEAWQVAYVYDPKSNEQGLFLRRNGQAVREKFLVDDGSDDDATGADDGNDGAAADAGAAQMVAPGTIAELSARVQHLERRQRWLVAAMWLLAILLAVWPAVVFVFGPRVASRLPPDLQRLLKLDRPSERPAPAPAKTAGATQDSSAHLALGKPPPPLPRTRGRGQG